ncbi:MAG: hypothetical protein KF760_04940 [Candidatus Eremiobacteraeota bacterium]|nr:hypothetical protein [Candidatus Eremiobacteraeota bacterium]
MKAYLRRPDLIEQPLGTEVLIYDSRTAHCHVLARQAAELWELLLLPHTLPELTEKFADKWPDFTREMMTVLLSEFQDKGLLADGSPETKSGPGRRKILKALGAGLLLSSVAPTAAAAASTTLRIINSRYGANIATRLLCGRPGVTLGNGDFNNVTTVIRGLISGNSLSVPVNNSGVLGSGPYPALVQELIVGYTCSDGVFRQERTCDGGLLTIKCP